MTKKFLFIAVLLCLILQISYTQAVDSLGCTGAVGDVKYSILDLTDFQGENGTCWVLMNGQNISGSRLATLTGSSTLPDARGYFIRSYDNRQSNRIDVDRLFGDPIATIQQDEFKSHNHKIGNYRIITNVASGSAKNPPQPWSGYELFTENRGGNETRPKNITLYTYIRIN